MKFKLIYLVLTFSGTAFCAQQPTQNKTSNGELQEVVVVPAFSVVAQPIQQPVQQQRQMEPMPIQLLQHMLWQGELPSGLSQDDITSLLTQREN